MYLYYVSEADKLYKASDLRNWSKVLFVLLHTQVASRSLKPFVVSTPASPPGLK